MSSQFQPAYNPGPPPPPQGPAKTPWYKKTWLIVVAAALIGIGVGGASAGGEADPTTSSAYKDVVAERDKAESDLEASQAEVDKLNTEVETIAGDLPKLQDELETGQAKLAEDQEALATTAADLDKRAKDLKKREEAVGVIESEIESNTIPGDGIYEVGRDMKPGTYRSPDNSESCYFAVLGSSDTSDIKTNDLGAGPKIVTVSEGDFFETSGCGDWTLG